MKLSEINDLNILKIEDYTRIVYNDVTQDVKDGDAIILLGGERIWCLERANACIELNQSIHIKYIIPTGGVEIMTDLTEAMYLKKLLVKSGIDEKKIILENQATTTRENMIYANKILKTIPNIKKVIIVTSHFHLRRAVELARNYLDKAYHIVGYSGHAQEGNKENWYKSVYYIERVKQEVYYLKSHIEKGYIKEIEY